MQGKSIIIGSAIFMAVLVGLVFLFTTGQKPDPKTIIYASDSTDRPKVEVEKGLIDLGDMSVNDIKSADFTVKNSGTKPLQIIGATTSCHCTNVQFIYREPGTHKNLTTKEFGMSNQAGYVTDIAPGDSFTVRVIYKPYIMPVFGAVEREAYVTTNDPSNTKLIFSIKMNVH